MDNRISLVLGAGGFLGATLCNYLTNKGISVRGFDRCERPSYVNNSSCLQWVKGDFLSVDDIDNSLSSVDIVYHLVSTMTPQSSNYAPEVDCEQNLIGTIRLLDLCASKNVKKVVYASSGGTVYGDNRSKHLETDPLNPSCSYAIVKCAVENYLALFKACKGLDYTTLRLSNPYGEFQRLVGNQGAIGVFIGKHLRGESIEVWGDGSVVRDYIYASDVADAFYKAAGYSGDVKIFNIGSGYGVSLNRIIELIERSASTELDVQYCPSRGVDLPYNVLDICLAKKELGWSPKVDLEDGIGSVIKYHLK